MPRDFRDREWKAAGQVAEFRSLACMMSLRKLAGKEFKGLGGLWVSGLLQEAHVYLQLETGKYLLCLGHVRSAALAWELEVVAVSQWHIF